PCEQVAEDRLELDPSDVRSHAEVLAEAEREMWVWAAIDAERERILEYLLVTVRRREVQGDPLAGADGCPAHLAVRGGGAREVADRAGPAQDLLHRVGHQLGVAAQLLPLVAVLAEGEQTPADRVARRLVPGLHQELAVGDQLLLVERLPLDLAADQLAHQVAPRVAAALVDERLEVGMQLAAGVLGHLARGLPRLAVLGVLLADHLVGPAEQPLPVVARNAEDPCDHRQREGRRYALDEVELARRARGRRLAEDVDRDPVDVGAGLTNRTRSEALVRHAAHETVLRGIEHY